MSFNDLLKTPCAILQPVSTTDDYGKPNGSYSTYKTVNGFLDPTSGKEFSKDGIVNTANYVLTIPTDTNIKESFRVQALNLTFEILAIKNINYGHFPHLELDLMRINNG